VAVTSHVAGRAQIVTELAAQSKRPCWRDANTSLHSANRYEVPVDQFPCPSKWICCLTTRFAPPGCQSRALGHRAFPVKVRIAMFRR
jgi:hypothetical protein